VPPEITYLEVRPDAEQHAKRFGAEKDGSGRWYVAGPVPNELMNYLPRKAGRRIKEIAPECPFCRGDMRKRVSRSGNLYWACAEWNRTGCTGTVDYVKYLEQVSPLPVLGEVASAQIQSLVSGLSSPEDPKGGERKHPLHERWLDIVTLAFAVLGNQRQVMRWMMQPKIALGRKTPILALGTAEGCDAVEHLLRELWD